MHGHALLISAIKNGIYSNSVFIACAPEMQRHAPFLPGTLKAELFHFMLMALQYQTSTNDIAQGLPNAFPDFIIKKIFCAFVLPVLVQTNSMSWSNSESVFAGISHRLRCES